MHAEHDIDSWDMQSSESAMLESSSSQAVAVSAAAAAAGAEADACSYCHSSRFLRVQLNGVRKLRTGKAITCHVSATFLQTLVPAVLPQFQCTTLHCLKDSVFGMHHIHELSSVVIAINVLSCHGLAPPCKPGHQPHHLAMMLY
jgi:hypothetical protein